MSHAADPPRRNRPALIVSLIAIPLAAAILLWGLFLRGDDAPAVTQTPTPTPSLTASQPQTPTPATPPAPSPSALGACTAVSEGFVPNRFTIERFDADEPVIALDVDDEGNIAAPPLDEPRMASWWSGGPQPGADAGRAILTIHTYRTGNALGNEFFDGEESRFEPGDLLKLYGPDGQVQCYEFTDAVKIKVADYDPDSMMMIDPDGPPSLSIIICWDFVKSTEVWESRVFFNFVPVTP